MFNLSNTLPLFMKIESLIVITLTAVSLISFWIVFSNDWVLIHTDAIGHLNIARKIDLGTPSGLGQLGGIWLPLQHLLLLPLVIFDDLYYSGIAGSVISMVSYIIASLFLYKFIYRFTMNVWAALIGTSIFALNPNILLYQSIPMLELLFFATIIVGVYFFSMWEEKGSYLNLAFSAFFLLLAAITRFEAWPIIFFLALVIVVKTFIKKRDFNFTQANLVYFLTIAGSGVAVWLIFLTVILGNPLFFLNSNYSPSVFVEAARFGGTDLIRGLPQITQLVFNVLVANTGSAVIYMGIVGLVLFLIHTKFKSLSPLSFLVPIVFYIGLVEAGQLLILYDQDFSYQVRYGMVVLLPIAFFVGYLINWKKLLTLWAILIISVTYFFMIQVDGVVTFNESKQNIVAASSKDSKVASALWLRENYEGGRVLTASFLNEEIFFYSRIPTGDFIHEGSQDLFKRALESPESEVDWVITNKNSSTAFLDIVNQKVSYQSLDKYFGLEYENSFDKIFHIKKEYEEAF